MKIGILSDTHNHLSNTLAVLSSFRAEGIDTLIHCGDLTNKELAAALYGFRVIHATGNGDADIEIRPTLIAMNPENFSGPVYTGEIDGVPVAVTHGNLTEKLDELVSSEAYRYIFFGHSHHRQDTQIGRCRLMNPGALGHLTDRYSALILDIHSGESRFIFP